MRLIDAYRGRYINASQYTGYLNLGYMPNDIYPGILPSSPSETVNSWTTALTWDTEGMGSKNIAIHNTDTVNALSYKVDLYVDTLLTDTMLGNISPNIVGQVYIEPPYTDIIVYVRSDLYGSTASYAISYTNSY